MKKNILSLIAVFYFIQFTYSQPNITVQAPTANYNSQTMLPGGMSGQNYARGCFLITANELAALTSTNITSIGFALEHGTGSIPVNGNMIIYLQNTTNNTYAKGTTFTNVISGMTNVYNGNMTIPSSPTSTANIMFSLTSGFNYTGGSIYVAYDWVTTPPASTCSTCGYTWYFTNQSSVTMASYRANPTNNPTFLSTLILSTLRPICIFEADNSATNEAAVLVIDAPGKVAEAMHTNHVIKAGIMNKSINSLTNLNVSLNITGANPFTDTFVISTLAPGASTTVSFSPFTPAQLGTNNISVYLPSDQNPTNNQLFWTQEVTCDVASNSPPNQTYTLAFGHASLPIECLGLFNFNATSTLTAVDINLVQDNTPNVTLCGLVMDNAGTVLAISNTMSTSQVNFNALTTFSFTPPLQMLMNQDYYIGMSESKGFYMAAGQATYHAGRFFSRGVSGGNPVPVNAYFGIEPVISGPEITISQSSTVMCLGESMVLSANGASSYTWSSSIFNPINDPYVSIITVTPTSNEIYGLYGEDDQGCSNSTSTPLAVKACTGIQGNTSSQTVRVFPNPTANGKTLVSGLTGETTLAVYNIIGELVFTKQSTDEIVTLDLSTRPVGTYLLKITDSNKGFKVVKLVNQE